MKKFNHAKSIEFPKSFSIKEKNRSNLIDRLYQQKCTVKSAKKHVYLSRNFRKNDSYSCSTSPRPLNENLRPYSFESTEFCENILSNTGNSFPCSPDNEKEISFLPPGPHTSPVDSPRLHTNTRSSREESQNPSRPESPHSIEGRRVRSIRRNAICSSNHLSKDLKEFFVSYVMSSLTESITNNLCLQSNSTADSSTALQDPEAKMTD